ncbi:UDP-N-acetylmuramate--L-alanine ligase [Magnetococcales bacterium HHB-1]
MMHAHPHTRFKKFQKLHFVGIGGIGMSGIAEILHAMDLQITGSDISENGNIERLRHLGLTIYKGHDARHIEGAQALVYSSAIKEDNPERLAAEEQGIPQIRRAEVLGELMRFKYSIAIAGTHGKTTTTSLVATLFSETGLDATLVNGGILKATGSNAHLGRDHYLITEADESDSSFLHLYPSMAIITSIDPEHLDHYGHFDHVKKAYLDFAERVPFYGLIILNHDHEETLALANQLKNRRIVTFGTHPDADFRAEKIKNEGVTTSFQAYMRDPETTEEIHIGEIEIPLPGEHNVSNALSTLAIARELDLPWEPVTQALAHFQGVKRRFDILYNHEERTIIDDYAHHPTEIEATIKAARLGYGYSRRIIVVFQPHRYSRVKECKKAFFRSFKGADCVFIDGVYAAGEERPAEFNRDNGRSIFLLGIGLQSQVPVKRLSDRDNTDWISELERELQPKDVILFLGAGDISQRAAEFVQHSQNA